MTASTSVESSFDVDSFLKEYYDAWSGTDLDRIMSFYTEDVVLQTPSALMTGREAVRDQFVRPFITAFAGNRHFVKKTIHGAGVVTVEFSFEAEHTGPFAGYAATGARIKLPGCGVYEYDSGKRQITSGRIYFDVATLLQSITLVNEPQEAVKALQLNERNLSVIINTIPTAAWTTRADGYCDFLNQRWLDYAGMTAEQAGGWGWVEAIHPEDRQALVEYWQLALAAGEPIETEGRLRRFDSSYRWFLFRANPLRDQAGTIVKWYGTSVDIDDRKKAEEALQASERNLSLTINSIPTFIAVTRPDGFILSVNQAALDYHGITLHDTQQGDFRTRFYHPDDWPRLGEDLKDNLERGRPFEYEVRALSKDGEYRWFLVRCNPLLDDQGKIDRWYVTAFDIEDRKRTEEALRKSERQFRLLVETIPALVWRSTPEGDLDYLNRRAVEYLGHTAESLAGGRWLELVHPDHRDATLQRWLQSATTGTAYEDEYQLQRADGQYRWIQSVGEPFLDTEDRIANWYGVVFDIDERKRAEDAQVRHSGVRADVSAAFSKPIQLMEILRGCTEAIVRHLDAVFARIWILNKEESMLELQASAGMYTRLDGSYSRIPVGELKVGLIAREKKAHFTNDVLNDPRVNDKGWAQRNGMVAFAGHPLVVEDRLIGVVALFARHTLPESILDTLASVADTIAQGIERKRAEESLRSALDEVQKSEAKLRQVIDAIPALAWCTLPDGSNEFLSKPWLEYTGLSLEESQGWGWHEAVHPDDLSPLMDQWTKMLVSGEAEEIEARLRRHDGVYRWFLIRAEPFRDESSEIVRWYGTSTDINDRKRAEEALQSSERNLRQVIDTIPTLIHVLRPDGSVLYVNPRVLDYTGLTLEEVQRGDYRARVGHPEDAEESLRERRGQALSSAVPFESEYRVLGKDGQYRWFLARYNPVLDDQGQIDRWYVTATDIDDRKRAEAQVEQARLRLAEAQELSKTGSFITDLLADDHDWSEEAFRIFEFDPATKVTVQMIRDTVHPDDLPSFDAMIGRGMAGTDVDFVFRIVTSRGALKHVRGLARVMAQIGGRPLFIGALQDITESKAAEEALSRARAELAHMARVTTLSVLTASISHEVNQPIAATIASAGACLRWLNRDQPDIQKARDAAVRIEQDVRRAAEIISHLKSFYKKDVSPLRELISVNELIDEMLVLLRSEADRHSVLMRTELAADQLQVTGDRVQLQQVLMNLMLNAMESMSERGGELKIRSRRDDNEVIVSVSDTGVGIPAGKMEEIFKAFVTTKAGGTGMGLAISSTIIESHSGRLWATPNTERGTSFHFTLPTEREAQSEQ